jgi:rubrerythrin
MKNTISILAFLTATSLLFLPACSSDTGKDNTLQAPETAQTVAQPDTQDANTATLDNLKTAFTGETTASAKYEAYSKKAQEEGHTQIALLFKATYLSEKIHANNHRAVLEDMGESVPTVNPQFTVKTTQENLTDAIAGEAYEIATMYPDFMATANAADNQLALTSLNYAYRTEQRHKPLYEQALVALQNNQIATLPGQYLVCPTCGNTYDTAPPRRCRISMTSNEWFIKIDAL